MLNVSIYLPNGTIDNTIDSSIYSFSEKNSSSYSSIFFTYSGLTAYTSITSTKNAALLSLSGATTTSTSLSTSAIHSYNEKVVVVYYVTTQISVAATTTYIPGLLKTTSTVSIYTLYTTDSNGSSSPIDIVVVMTPDVVTTSLRRYYRNSSTISTESLLSYFRMSESFKKNIATTKNVETSSDSI
ncbi:uncharacterized protein PWA37_003346 [Arxiozyma heterogenica]|uniref:uncharacterized protein n=1 Tax=Arxiozyma heterogenica TaxID=278026 RepID=UPI002F1752A7